MPDPLLSLSGLLDRIALSAVRLQGWKSRFIDTPDGNIHLFDIQGRGTLPPILLLHGLGARSADYAPLVGRLKRLTRRLIRRLISSLLRCVPLLIVSELLFRCGRFCRGNRRRFIGLGFVLCFF